LTVYGKVRAIAHHKVLFFSNQTFSYWTFFVQINRCFKWQNDGLHFIWKTLFGSTKMICFLFHWIFYIFLTDFLVINFELLFGKKYKNFDIVGWGFFFWWLNMVPVVLNRIYILMQFQVKYMDLQEQIGFPNFRGL
jgi:hypothetical protein